MSDFYGEFMEGIEFRCWNTQWERFQSGCDVIAYDGKIGHDISTAILWQNGEHRKNYVIHQWTGLKDRNGKKIFEGDIVAIYPKDKTAFGEKSVFVIEKQMTLWGFEFAWNHISGYECSTHILEDDCSNVEVIGDIFQNPELLKK